MQKIAFTMFFFVSVESELHQILVAVELRDLEKVCQACIEHVYNASAVALQALQAQQRDQQQK